MSPDQTVPKGSSLIWVHIDCNNTIQYNTKFIYIVGDTNFFFFFFDHMCGSRKFCRGRGSNCDVFGFFFF